MMHAVPARSRLSVTPSTSVLRRMSTMIGAVVAHAKAAPMTAAMAMPRPLVRRDSCDWLT